MKIHSPPSCSFGKITNKKCNDICAGDGTIGIGATDEPKT